MCMHTCTRLHICNVVCLCTYTCAHICGGGASLKKFVRQQSLAPQFERPPYPTIAHQWVCAMAESRLRVCAVAATCPVVRVAVGANPRLGAAAMPHPGAVCSRDALIGALHKENCATGGALFQSLCGSGNLLGGSCCYHGTCMFI